MAISSQVLPQKYILVRLFQYFQLNNNFLFLQETQQLTMKQTLLFLLFSFLFAPLFGQDARSEYIKKYSKLAIAEMMRCGIPASITLAQGCLESNNGRSELATEGNNHFGIKCKKDWTGKRIYHDDDEKGECFRRYAHAEESYTDHSDFLRNSPRYAFLFQLDPTDYVGWAVD
jgi:hypothetical protein